MSRAYCNDADMLVTAAPRIRLIGTTVVVREHDTVEIGRPRQRAVLAALALHRGNTVPAADLCRAVWGDAAPASAWANLQTYVSNLRRILEPDTEVPRWLCTDESGYRLRVPAAKVDIMEFDRLVDRAESGWSAGDVAGCLRALAAADALWRGSPLAGIDGPLAERESARLWQRRRSSRRLYVEALLATGAAAQAVVESTTLARENPFDEHSGWLLGLSLYRCGRVDDALFELSAIRHRVQDELGVRPGPELTNLHEEILTEHVVDPAPYGHGGHAVQPCAPDGVAVANPDTPGSTVREPDAAGAAAFPGSGDRTPEQLPRRPRGFAGRADELAMLGELVADMSVPTVVSGHVGIGKTALVLECAHRFGHSFPHGRVYLDVAGSYAGERMAAGEVLDCLLYAFGVREVPAGLEAKQRWLRSALEGRRPLIVLDDVTEVGQVLPVLAARRDSSVVVASRYRLSALQGTVALRVSGLDPAASITVLRTGSPGGIDSVRASGTQLEPLARLCGHVPLALRAMAARLASASGPDPVPSPVELVDELGDAGLRLRRLSIGGESRMSIVTAFDHVWHGLSVDARRLLALLGQLPDACSRDGCFRPDDPALEDSGEADVLLSALAELFENCLVDTCGDHGYRLPGLARACGARYATGAAGS